jgi:Phage T7 capsid assembly protein
MMTENLLEAGLAEAQRSEGPDSPALSGERMSRPAGLPDKFWDERTGQVRVDALIKSYLELERKLSASGNRDVPSGPEHYNINVTSDLLGVDAEVNRRLHGAGFSQQQAQLVYDLACDRLMPMIAELASVFEAESQIQRLTQHFGGEERWREIARQIDA